MSSSSAPRSQGCAYHPHKENDLAGLLPETVSSGGQMSGDKEGTGK